MTMDGPSIHSANLTTIVYGAGVPDALDCSETWFEASKVRRESMGWDCPGIQVLQNSPALQEISSRGARSYDHLPRVNLGAPEYPVAALGQVLLDRRSSDVFLGSMTLKQLSGLLRYGAGMTDVKGRSSHLRTTPSAGALHPLDLFFYGRHVDDLQEGVYYYLPQENQAVKIATSLGDAISSSFFDAAGSSDSAVIILIACSFWRTRFKYGHRGLRFCLIEAGHMAQNFLLLSTAYGLPSRALGGFVDDEVNERIPSLNGVDTALLYALAIG
ncbi:SagB/ThcOx family dehydrogenase [Actinomyces sp. 2119]|uniref:SagB/ThcOx family dehydrogenase n=2 Tax=Actinomycetaceae TaxID=2049 RepID=A0ABN5PQH4_9ACTO|nr:SagB/ThcOx family dehydrogenase [Actinomyces lilanjuaniae]RJF43942.1 SagB/ThcOx family dehydrogenase [Actinomyces sp. 2119]